MLALFLTLFDIIRLRKGPDAIPYSWIVSFITLILWLLAGLAITAATDGMNDRDFLNGTFTGVVGLACYAAVIVSHGHTPRLLQTVSAILGCGAMISFLFLASNVVLGYVAQETTVRLVGTLILLWSVPVEGHIIARAIDRQWFIGIIMAIAVFIFQLYLYTYLDPNPVT